MSELQSVIDNYRGLESYSDCGIVTVEIDSSGKKFSGANKLLTGTIFATNFVRAKIAGLRTETEMGSKTNSGTDHFRYQWTNTGHFAELREDNLNFICANLEGVFKRYPDEGLSRCESLSLAVADAAAVSYAGAYYMASLLIAGIVSPQQWFFNRLSDIEVVNDTVRASIKDGQVELVIDYDNLTFSAITVTRPTSTSRFVWEQVFLNEEVNLRTFDQYRF